MLKEIHSGDNPCRGYPYWAQNGQCKGEGRHDRYWLELIVSNHQKYGNLITRISSSRNCVITVQSWIAMLENFTHDEWSSYIDLTHKNYHKTFWSNNNLPCRWFVIAIFLPPTPASRGRAGVRLGRYGLYFIVSNHRNYGGEITHISSYRNWLLLVKS